VSPFRKDEPLSRRMRHTLLAGLAAFGFGLGMAQALAQDEVEAVAQGEAVEETAAEDHGTVHYPLKKPEMMDWSFAGVFGTYDRGQLQRGFQVYREVCASCHGLKYVAFRTLADADGPGFTAAQVAALAAEYQIADGPNTDGDMFERPGRPSDRFPSPFPNDQAAAVANGGAVPPDLSLIAKARSAPRGPLNTVLDFFTQYQEAGPDYIHALLTGYEEEPPHGIVVPDGVYYNPYFLGGPALAMPPPLSDGVVTYADGSPETIDQYSKDVSAFLMWSAEPHLMARKRLGFSVIVFLLVFATLMYLTKRRVWAAVAH
jgi:ubiquinol-cytochrome c reductase cytochrome c1 subunit